RGVQVGSGDRSSATSCRSAVHRHTVSQPSSDRDDPVKAFVRTSSYHQAERTPVGGSTALAGTISRPLVGLSQAATWHHGELVGRRWRYPVDESAGRATRRDG